MSAKMKKPSQWSKILTSVLIVLLIFGLLGAAVYLLNPNSGRNGEYTDFTVTLNGNAVALESEMTIYTEQDYEFKIAYSNGEQAIEEQYEFTVDVIPNATVETEFQFTVDGETLWFSDVETLKSAFTIEKTSDGFTISAPEAFTMQDILSAVYGDKNLIVPENVSLGKYYTLVISSYDGEIQYNIDFDVSDNSSVVNPPQGDDEPADPNHVPVESITLDKEAIVL